MHKKIGVAEQWDELGKAGGEFWKLLNHLVNIQRQKIKVNLLRYEIKTSRRGQQVNQLLENKRLKPLT
ncbi:hypothetical protein [Nostoc sp.]|uniref:hypothetical protein n=1 Tax=Nostoc sp. TaxID=1180 RepID=UPI002FFD37D6